MSVSTIKAILFDADGVIQRPSPVRHSLWAQLLGGTVPVDAFLHDVFDAERACYIGVGDFQRRFGELLDRWNCTGDLGAALQAWTAIEVDCTILEMIAMLRASGHPCYLASNQEPYRARYMSETLLYKAAFDGEFYSCTVGHAKPAPAYFRAILDALAVRAEDTLFIDDLSTNVEAARGVGLRASVFAPAPHQRWHDHLRRVLARQSRLTVRAARLVGPRKASDIGLPRCCCASAAPWNQDCWSREVGKGISTGAAEDRKPLRRRSSLTTPQHIDSR